MTNLGQWQGRTSLRQRVMTVGVGLATIAASVLAAGIGGASAPPPNSSPDLPVPPRIAAEAPRSPPASIPDHSMPQATPLRRFTATVGADLSESLRAAGVSDDIAHDYVLQMMRVERFVSEISVADRFDLVVLELPGEKPTLVYAGMDRVGRGDLQFLKYGDESGNVEWVDARGLERRESAGMMLPVGGRVTSGFGTRMHPMLRLTRFHRGIDLAAQSGSPIRAAADGRVVRAGWAGGYGRQVALAHGGGLDTSYSHLSRIIARPGEVVRRGQVIGLAGSSGLSTGPHLHFEARINGRSIDPRKAKIDIPVAMSSTERAAFNGTLRSVLTAGATTD